MAEKEYIERDMMYKFIELFNTQYSDNIVLTKASLQHLIDIFPSADVAPMKHGHWVKEKPDVLIHWHCSVCKNCYYLEEPNANYCPNCGAKIMDGGEEND